MAALISPGALLFHPHHAGEREKGWLWVDDTSPYFKSRITNALLARRLMNAEWMERSAVSDNIFRPATYVKNF